MSDKTTTILGKVSITPRGLYDATANYEKLDIITHNGSSFLALKAFQGVEPISDSETTMLLSSKGKDLKFSDLTPEEVERLKLHFSDLTGNEIALLQEPAEVAAIAANSAASAAIAAASAANTSTGKANEATAKALGAAKAAEGIVSDIRPDHNVDDKTLSTFIANRPEIPVLTSAITKTTLTYTNSYGNVVKFRAGDKAIVEKKNGTLAYYTAAKVSATEIEWVQDWGNNAVTNILPENIQKGKYYVLHASEDGKSSGTLVETADQTALLESLYMYGIEKDTEIASTACTRIGNMGLHKSLPLQSKMRRCVIKPVKDKVDPVVCYLNENDSRAVGEIKRHKFIQNPFLVGDLAHVSIVENFEDELCTFISTGGDVSRILPNVTFSDLKVGDVVKVNGRLLGGTGGTIQILHALNGAGATSSDIVLIKERVFEGDQTDRSFAEEFTVTSEMLTGRYIGIKISSLADGGINMIIDDAYTPAKLDGTDGDVMVELPEFYIKFEEEGTKQRVKISERFIPGYEYIPKAYVGAFLGALRNHSIIGSGTSEMSSVINNTPGYRGGDLSVAQVAWDTELYSMLGRPYAKKISDLNWYSNNKNQNGVSGWSGLTTRSWMALHWFCVIEYSTFDYTAGINNQKTAEGYAQGGVGAGLTGFISAHVANFFPDRYGWAVAKIGHTVSLGNKTGEITLDVPKVGLTADNKYAVNSYRGVENMFSRVRVESNWDVSLTSTDTYIQCRYDAYLGGAKTKYIIPGWGSWNKIHDFSRDYGMIQKAHDSNANYTNTYTNKEPWSQAHTVSMIKCGVAYTASKRWGTIANTTTGTQYDGNLDTQTNARINYTLPR